MSDLVRALAGVTELARRSFRYKETKVEELFLLLPDGSRRLVWVREAFDVTTVCGKPNLLVHLTLPTEVVSRFKNHLNCARRSVRKEFDKLWELGPDDPLMCPECFAGTVELFEPDSDGEWRDGTCGECKSYTAIKRGG